MATVHCCRPWPPQEGATRVVPPGGGALAYQKGVSNCWDVRPDSVSVDKSVPGILHVSELGLITSCLD